jgi:hypothetical protein
MTSGRTPGAEAAEKIEAAQQAIPTLLGPSTNPTEAEKIGAAEAAWDFDGRRLVEPLHGSRLLRGSRPAVDRPNHEAKPPVY